MNNTEEIIGVESCLYANTEETDLTLEGSIHKKMMSDNIHLPCIRA